MSGLSIKYWSQDEKSGDDVCYWALILFITNNHDSDYSVPYIEQLYFQIFNFDYKILDGIDKMTNRPHHPAHNFL
jgi:hypothetical protein